VNAQLVPVIAALSHIGVQYPDEEIVVRIKGPDITVGFVKGTYGDQQHAAWCALAPHLEYQSPQ
jgi:hypothetical protein